MTDMDEFKAKFQRLLELRQTYDIANAAFNAAKKEYRQYEAELYQELEDAGIRGRHEFDFGGDLGVAKFTRRATHYGRVLDKTTLIAALKKEGLDDAVIGESISEGRLNELIRERLENKQEFPEGADFYDRKLITISRS